MLSVFLAHVFRSGIAHERRTKCCPFFSHNFPLIGVLIRFPVKGVGTIQFPHLPWWLKTTAVISMPSMASASA